MKSLTVELYLIVGIAVLFSLQSFACDKDMCRDQAKQISRGLHGIRNEGDKQKALEFLKLHETCACGVLEGSYSIGYLAQSETLVDKLKKYDGTVVESGWIKSANNRAAVQSKEKADAGLANQKAYYEAMVSKINATSDWHKYGWTFAGTAYENSSHPCKPVDIKESEKLKNAGCQADELHEEKGTLFFKCSRATENSFLGIVGYYKDEATCRKCFPRISHTKGNPFPDTSHRCYDNLRKKFGK